MTIRQYNLGGNPNGSGRNPFGLVGGVIMLVVGLILAYFILSGLFTLLFWLSPVLLIAGIAVDPKSALKLGKSFLNLSKKNPLIPLGLIIISAMAIKLVPAILAALIGGFLLSKYFVKKKIKEVFDQVVPHSEKEEPEEFAEYEDVTDDEEFLNLPPLEPKVDHKQNSTNEYDNLF